MKIIKYSELDKSEFLKNSDFEELACAKEIIEQVKLNKDNAIIEYSNKFKDGDFKTSDDFLVTEEEIKKAFDAIDPKLLEAIKKAIENVKEFSLAQLNCLKNLELEKENSIIAHKIIPLNRVLCYCPGGNYPLISSAYMTIVPAVVAGVKEIYLTSPKIKPEVIVSAVLSGATKIYKLGGVQAIAGFAYGTEAIKPVDKITGPGNKFVAAAKKEVYGTCDIDFIAGPSEVMIIADKADDAKIIASDMLAQCEHDKDARAYLITDNIELAKNVEKEAQEILKTLKTKEIAQASFEKSSAIIVDDINQAIELANKKAPEHLELIFNDADKLKDKFTNYGSLFINKNCAEVFGDYCSGTNHVLPTNGCAKYTGGLSVFDYVKIQTYQKLDEKYSKELSKIASVIAQAEGLDGHRLSSELRG